MAHDDGTGFDYPIIENNDLCIFDIGDSYVLRKKYVGDIRTFDKKAMAQDGIDKLIKEGWQRVNIDE